MTHEGETFSPEGKDVEPRSGPPKGWMAALIVLLVLLLMCCGVVLASVGFYYVSPGFREFFLQLLNFFTAGG